MMMKGNISLAITVVLVLSILFTPYPSSAIQSRTIASANWNGPGGNGEHNGYFPSFSDYCPLVKKWEVKLPPFGNNPPLNLCLTSNELIVAYPTTSTIFFINKADGKQLAKKVVGNFSKGYIASDGTKAYIGTSNGVSSYNTKNGNLEWQTSDKFQLTKEIRSNTPYVVFSPNPWKGSVKGAVELYANYGSMLAWIIDTDFQGKTEWVELPDPDFKPNQEILEMPAASSTRAVACNGNIYFDRIIDKKTVVESHPAPAIPSGPICINNSQIVYAGNNSFNKNNIVKTAGDSSIMMLDCSYNKIKWRKDFKDFAILSTPSFDGFSVYISCSDGIRCLDGTSGNELWHHKTDSSIYSQPIITGKHVFFGSTDSFLYAITKTKGELVWKEELTSRIVSSTMALDAEQLFVLADDGTLMCFEPDKSDIPAQIKINVTNARSRIGRDLYYTISVLNRSGIRLDVSKVKYSVEPSDFGEINSSAFTPRKLGKCKIIAQLENLRDELEITIVNAPPKCNDKLDMGTIGEYQTISKTITFTSASDFPTKITLKAEKDYCFFDQGSFELAPKQTIDIKVTTEGTRFEKNGVHKTSIVATNEDGESINIVFIVNKKGMVGPNTIDKYLDSRINPREGFRTITIKVTNPNQDDQLKITAKSDSEWIKAKTNEFTIEPNSDFLFEVEINQSLFDFSEKKQAKIELKWQKSSKFILIEARSVADTFPPEITIDPVKTFKNAKFGNITGTIEVGCTLALQVENGYANVPVAAGKFSLTVNLLPGPSINRFTLVAKDSLGNQVEKVVEIINSGILTVRMQIGNPVMTVGDKSIPISPAPMVYKGATIIPLRALSEAFGAKVEFANGEITVTLREKVVKLKIGSNIASINGSNMPVNPAPVIIQGKTMLPFRFIAEALGAQVFWDQSSKTITMQTEVWPSK